MGQNAHVEEMYSEKSNKISDLTHLFFLGIESQYFQENIDWIWE